MNVTSLLKGRSFALDSATKHGYQFLTELKGVCIGDVGIQPFDFLSRDDPINPEELPDIFLSIHPPRLSIVDG